MFGFLKKHDAQLTAEAQAIETEHHRRRIMQLTAHKPAVLRMNADRESDRLGELARGCIVEVLETVTLPEGTERGRTDLGWLTIVKEETIERCAFTLAWRCGPVGRPSRSLRAHRCSVPLLPPSRITALPSSRRIEHLRELTAPERRTRSGKKAVHEGKVVLHAAARLPPEERVGLGPMILCTPKPAGLYEGEELSSIRLKELPPGEIVLVTEKKKIADGVRAALVVDRWPAEARGEAEPPTARRPGRVPP